MRTQLLHDDADVRSWRLPQVDPTGWLAGRPGVDFGPGAVQTPWPAAEVDRPGVVRRRRPRRTEAARTARERDLARRRRRRHGRSFAVDHQVAARPGWAARPASPIGRVADRSGRTAGSAPDAGYRIGRWGRLALTVLVTATLVLVVGRLVAGSIAGSVAPELVDVTVRPGDTLWSIASSAAPDRDPRAVIDDIRELNDVSGDLVRVGEVLRVPASSG